MMDQILHTTLHLLTRDAPESDVDNGPTVTVPLAGQPGHCEPSNDYNGLLGARISAIFVILVTSFLGTWLPVFSRNFAERNKWLEYTFFGAKYFGSGVIIATAFIHLLAPANEALTNSCLTGPITEYSWVEGIALMTVFVLFFVELMTMRYANFGHSHTHEHSHSHSDNANGEVSYSDHDDKEAAISANSNGPNASHAVGADHLGHQRDHVHNDFENVTLGQVATGPKSNPLAESYTAQMTAIFILEFGVIFHSIFIGLTLAVSGSEFETLYIVLVFHQTFEGLGLGTRLAQAPWPKTRRGKWTPYVLGFGYALSTPIAIAVGLGIRTTYAPGSQTALITNGVFDSISAGILIYTGLVELMAHEFMFSPTMARAKISIVLAAFALMCAGAGLMALLGKWA